MRIKNAICALVLSAAVATPASALVVQSNYGILTESGQDFDFNLSGLPASDGTGATVTLWSGRATVGTPADDGFDIDGLGDSGTYEFVQIVADGTNLGRYSCGGGYRLIENHTLNGNADCEFSFGVSIAGNLFDGMITDGNLNLEVNFGSGVGHFGDRDLFIVQLAYEEYVDTPPVPGVPGGDDPIGSEDPTIGENPGVVATPLPATGLLLLGGLAAVAATRRRKAKS